MNGYLAQGPQYDLQPIFISDSGTSFASLGSIVLTRIYLHLSQMRMSLGMMNCFCD